MPDTSPPTWDTVKRLFSGADISFMKMYGYDFDDPEFVATNVDTILSRIEDGSMPPKPEFAPWSPERIQTLKNWKTAGFPRSATVNAELSKFIQMSEFLTGFDDLHDDPGLAAWYLDRLKKRSETNGGVNQGGVNQAVLKSLMDEFDPSDTAKFERDTLTKPDCERVARTIILLWYTASFMDLGLGFPAGTEATGTPEDNRYISGLMWRAFHAHPMGYSSEGWYDHHAGKYSLKGEPYWKFKPEPNGQNTGLGPNSIEP